MSDCEYDELMWDGEPLCDDREEVMAAINCGDFSLSHASITLRGDREVVMAAIKKRGGAELIFASKSLRRDRDVVMAAATEGVFEYAMKSRTTETRWREGGFEYASSELRFDREVVMAAVKHDGLSLRWTSEVLCGDREVVMTAVKENGGALQFASEELCADREVVMAAVQCNHLALEFASEELRADREVVMAAVQSERLIWTCSAWDIWSPINDHALHYASEELRGDREVVMTAVKHQQNAFMYASRALRADREVVLAAVKQDGHALSDALPVDIREDPYMRRLAARSIWRKGQPPRVLKFLEVARLRRMENEAKLQAQIDLWLTVHNQGELLHWVEACSHSFKRRKRARLVVE